MTRNTLGERVLIRARQVIRPPEPRLVATWWDMLLTHWPYYTERVERGPYSEVWVQHGWRPLPNGRPQERDCAEAVALDEEVIRMWSLLERLRAIDHLPRSADAHITLTLELEVELEKQTLRDTEFAFERVLCSPPLEASMQAAWRARHFGTDYPPAWVPPDYGESAAAEIADPEQHALVVLGDEWLATLFSGIRATRILNTPTWCVRAPSFDAALLCYQALNYQFFSHLRGAFFAGLPIDKALLEDLDRKREAQLDTMRAHRPELFE